MSQPVISVRQLDSNHDPIYGNGQGNFLVDIMAVAQIIQTTLLLFQGEWWANLTEGVPMFQSILGSNNGKKIGAIAALLQNAIFGVPYVTGISNVVTNFSPNRTFQFGCIVTTQFGSVSVNFQPGNSAVLPV